MIPRVANGGVSACRTAGYNRFQVPSGRLVPRRPPLSRRLLRLLKLPILTPHNDRDDGRHRRARTGLRGFGLTGSAPARGAGPGAPRLSLRAVTRPACGEPTANRRWFGDGRRWWFGFRLVRRAPGLGWSGPDEIHDTTTLETGEYLLRERRARHERSPPIRRESDDPISHDADGATVQ